MARKPILLAACALMLLCTARPAHAQTVRGRVERIARGVAYPVEGAEVKLYAPGKGYSSASYTGPDGFYYFYGVAPGQYTIFVRTPWGAQRTIDIHVQSRPITDIRPVALG